MKGTNVGKSAKRLGVRKVVEREETDDKAESRGETSEPNPRSWAG